MKLLRLKITDPAGFRSLPCDFEHHFRTEWSLQEEKAKNEGFAPFVCAGPNGSGKSNLLEALAAIFYQLEIQRVRRSFLPEVLQNEALDFSPTAFELDYLIRVPAQYRSPDSPKWAQVSVRKNTGESVRLLWENQEVSKGSHADILLPQYVLGYSSGENEILSLPFFKMRFIQFDEYWNALTQQLPYPGRPDTRLAYLDNGFSQAILLCNLLFQDEATLQPFRDEVGIGELKEFRIILRRSIPMTRQQVAALTAGEPEDFFEGNAAITPDPETDTTRLHLLQGLEGDERTSIIEKLKRCATLYFHDEATDTLILDYWVNDQTKKAFRANFDNSALALFQALQVLLTLNLYAVSDALKADLYTSTSHYVSETVPTLASDARIMRFKNFYFKKKGVEEAMLLKELSDGEHQLLHSLGLCLLFRDTNSLFLLDEPETHFNPVWRASFISRLDRCLGGETDKQAEMLITTHSPFLISDSTPDKVLLFAKDEASGAVQISRPDYNTLGASINKITMLSFGKRETVGGRAEAILNDIRKRFEQGENPKDLIDELDRRLGDSVEKVLLVNTLLNSDPQANAEGRD
ncbi:MAG: restriction system-associated AAA family ATPase [Candidatus Competibacteraceae bacterium]|nr:restriction system-associated AAA family ATPase [Candidatus Competibacteraceae bacterium]